MCRRTNDSLVLWHPPTFCWLPRLTWAKLLSWMMLTRPWCLWGWVECLLILLSLLSVVPLFFCVPGSPLRASVVQLPPPLPNLPPPRLKFHATKCLSYVGNCRWRIHPRNRRLNEGRMIVNDFFRKSHWPRILRLRKEVRLGGWGFWTDLFSGATLELEG